MEWTSVRNGPIVDGARLATCPREAIEDEASGAIADLVENGGNHDGVIYQVTRFQSTGDPSPELGSA
jgi:hypothetical protein